MILRYNNLEYGEVCLVGSGILETCVKEHNAEAVLSEQFGYAARVKEIVTNKYNLQPLAYVHTFGCQQNVSDSERLKGLLDLMGYGFTDEITASIFICDQFFFFDELIYCVFTRMEPFCYT